MTSPSTSPCIIASRPEKRRSKAFCIFTNGSSQKLTTSAHSCPAALKSKRAFVALDPDAEHLTPLATSFRYPDDYVPLNPTRAEFDEALAAAQRVYDFVLSLLPAETHPT